MCKTYRAGKFNLISVFFSLDSEFDRRYSRKVLHDAMDLNQLLKGDFFNELLYMFIEIQHLPVVENSCALIHREWSFHMLRVFLILVAVKVVLI